MRRLTFDLSVKDILQTAVYTFNGHPTRSRVALPSDTLVESLRALRTILHSLHCTPHN